MKRRWQLYGIPMLAGAIAGTLADRGIKLMPATWRTVAAALLAAVCVSLVVSNFIQFRKANEELHAQTDAHRERLRAIFTDGLNKFKDDVLRDIIPAAHAERIRKIGQGGWLN